MTSLAERSWTSANVGTCHVKIFQTNWNHWKAFQTNQNNQSCNQMCSENFILHCFLNSRKIFNFSNFRTHFTLISNHLWQDRNKNMIVRRDGPWIPFRCVPLGVPEGKCYENKGFGKMKKIWISENMMFWPICSDSVLIRTDQLLIPHR